MKKRAIALGLFSLLLSYSSIGQGGSFVSFINDANKGTGSDVFFNYIAIGGADVDMFTIVMVSFPNWNQGQSCPDGRSEIRHATHNGSATILESFCHSMVAYKQDRDPTTGNYSWNNTAAVDDIAMEHEYDIPSTLGTGGYVHMRCEYSW